MYGLNKYMIDINIETLAGTTFSLKVSPLETVHSVKAKIQRHEGIPISHQHLVWQSSELEDKFCLNDYHIPNGATIRMVLALRGGPINTRRINTEDSLLRDVSDLMEIQEDSNLWNSNGNGNGNGNDSSSHSINKHVTLLLFRDGDQLNLLRVIDRGDASSPISGAMSAASMYVPYDETDHEAAATPVASSNIDDEGNLMLSKSAKPSSSSASSFHKFMLTHHHHHHHHHHDHQQASKSGASSSKSKKSSANIENQKTREKMLELKSKMSKSRRVKSKTPVTTCIAVPANAASAEDSSNVTGQIITDPVFMKGVGGELPPSDEQEAIKILNSDRMKTSGSRPVVNVRLLKKSLTENGSQVVPQQDLVSLDGNSISRNQYIHHQQQLDQLEPELTADDEEDDEEEDEYYDDEDDEDDDEEYLEDDEYDEDENEDDYDYDDGDDNIDDENDIVEDNEDDDQENEDVNDDEIDQDVIYDDDELLNHRRHSQGGGVLSGYDTRMTNATLATTDIDTEEAELLLSSSKAELLINETVAAAAIASTANKTAGADSAGNQAQPIADGGGLTDQDLMAIMMMHLNHTSAADQLSLHNENGGVSSSLATTALPTVLTPAGLYTTAENENFLLAPYSSGGSRATRARNRFLRRVSRCMPDGTISSTLEYVSRGGRKRNAAKREVVAVAATVSETMPSEESTATSKITEEAGEQHSETQANNQEDRYVNNLTDEQQQVINVLSLEERKGRQQLRRRRRQQRNRQVIAASSQLIKQHNEENINKNGAEIGNLVEKLMPPEEAAASIDAKLVRRHRKRFDIRTEIHQITTSFSPNTILVRTVSLENTHKKVSARQAAERRLLKQQQQMSLSQQFIRDTAAANDATETAENLVTNSASTSSAAHYASPPTVPARKSSASTGHTSSQPPPPPPPLVLNRRTPSSSQKRVSFIVNNDDLPQCDGGKRECSTDLTSSSNYVTNITTSVPNSDPATSEATNELENASITSLQAATNTSGEKPTPQISKPIIKSKYPLAAATTSLANSNTISVLLEDRNAIIKQKQTAGNSSRNYKQKPPVKLDSLYNGETVAPPITVDAATNTTSSGGGVKSSALLYNSSSNHHILNRRNTNKKISNGDAAAFNPSSTANNFTSKIIKTNLGSTSILKPYQPSLISASNEANRAGLDLSGKALNDNGAIELSPIYAGVGKFTNSASKFSLSANELSSSNGVSGKSIKLPPVLTSSNEGGVSTTTTTTTLLIGGSSNNLNSIGLNDGVTHHKKKITDLSRYCSYCKRKTGLASSYICRCGNNYCTQHRNAEAHNCSFDYKTEGRKLIEQSNPLVAAPKLPKI